MSDMGQKLSSYDEAVQDTAASAALDSSPGQRPQAAPRGGVSQVTH